MKTILDGNFIAKNEQKRISAYSLKNDYFTK